MARPEKVAVVDEIRTKLDESDAAVPTEYGGLTVYAKDAMEGLDLANQLFSAPTRDAMVARLKREQAALTARAVGPNETKSARWTEDNPGRWLYHCHVFSHQDMGMAGWYIVE